MQYQPIEAYRIARQKTAAPRELEAGLLLSAAALLHSVATTAVDGTSRDRTPLAVAMTFNCKIWTILVTSALRAECRLPEAARQSIAELGLFVIQRTAHALGAVDDLHPGDAIDVLIEINRSVASGLRS